MAIFHWEKTGEEFDGGFQANSDDMRYLPAARIFLS